MSKNNMNYFKLIFNASVLVGDDKNSTQLVHYLHDY
jgi:hypothetical protein